MPSCIPPQAKIERLMSFKSTDTYAAELDRANDTIRRLQTEKEQIIDELEKQMELVDEATARIRELERMEEVSCLRPQRHEIAPLASVFYAGFDCARWLAPARITAPSAA